MFKDVSIYGTLCVMFETMWWEKSFKITNLQLNSAVALLLESGIGVQYVEW